MTVIGLPHTASPGDAVGAPPPRRRRSRIVLARLGAGLAVLVPIVLLSSFITYSLRALSNSDPAATILGQDAATPAAVARLNASLGLNHPLIVQYWNWLFQAAQGNLGRSYFTQIPVSQSIAQRLPVDLSIAVLAVILAVIIGGGAGTIAAVRRGGWFDRTVTAACSAASTLPAFVVGIILVVLFALTILGNDFPLMLAGAVAAEAVFSLPGLGQLLLESAQSRDIPVVQGLLLVVSCFVIVVNLIVNVTLNWLYRTDDGIGA